MPAICRLAGEFMLDDTDGDQGSWLSSFDRILENPTYDPDVRVLLEQLRFKAVVPDRHNDPKSGSSTWGKVANPAEVHSRLNEGLLLAVQQRDLELAGYYIHKGADLNVKDDESRNVLVIAVENEDNPMISLVVSHGLTWDDVWVDDRIQMIKGVSQHGSLTLSLAINKWDFAFDDRELQLLYEVCCMRAWLDNLKAVLDAAEKHNKLIVIGGYQPTWREDHLGIPVLEILACPYGLLGESGCAKLFLWMCTAERMSKIPEFLTWNPSFDPTFQVPVRLDNNQVRVRCLSADHPCCICWAAAEASPEVVASLLRRVVKRVGHVGIATRRGYYDITRLLLEWGDNANTVCDRGLSPIHHAVDLGPNNEPRSDRDVIRMIELLETAGANLAATYRGGNAVHYAMTSQSMMVVRYLVSRGIDMHAEDCVGERPLHVAIHQRFDSGLGFILQSSLQVDTINRGSDHCGTPLYCAAREGSVTIVEKLLCAGAYVNAVLLPGNILGPALYVACAEGHVELVRALLSHGADMNIETARYENAMDVAYAFEQSRVLEVLQGYGKSDIIYQEINTPSQALVSTEKATTWKKKIAMPIIERVIELSEDSDNDN